MPAIEKTLFLRGFNFLRVNAVKIAQKKNGEKIFVKALHGKGWADIIVFPGNRCPDLAIEAKSQDGVLSKSQIAWRDRWIRGGRRYILVRPDNWLELLDQALKTRLT